MRFSVSNILMLFWLMLMFIQPVQAKTSDVVIDDKLVCMIETQKQEKNFQIKKHLLTTISNVESGRWDKEAQRNVAWPWTINAEGKGMFFETKAEAVKEVKRLQKEGVKSIDVGCMQINLIYHGDNFESIEDALDPAQNVAYGAKFLKTLYSKKGDWMQSAMAYHSSVSDKADVYKQKIAAMFEKTKKASSDLDNKFVIAKNNSDKIKAIKAEEPIQIAMASTSQPVRIEIADRVVEKPARAVKKSAGESADEWREARLQEYRQRRMK